MAIGEKIEGRWLQVKGAIQKKWGKLTDDDIDYIAGNYDELIGKLMVRYDVDRPTAEKMYYEWEKSYEYDYSGV